MPSIIVDNSIDSRNEQFSKACGPIALIWFGNSTLCKFVQFSNIEVVIPQHKESGRMASFNKLQSENTASPISTTLFGIEID